MHAIEVTATGGPEVLKYVDTPRPWPGTGEVLIKAEARFVLGAEIGDTVEARDDGVTTLRVGDRVATADAGAAYAEYCITAADVVALVPDAVTTDVAAAAILKGMEAQLSRQAGAVMCSTTPTTHSSSGQPSDNSPAARALPPSTTARASESTFDANVSAHYPLMDAAQAHRDLESRETVGSVVLTP